MTDQLTQEDKEIISAALSSWAESFKENHRHTDDSLAIVATLRKCESLGIAEVSDD